jgi:hypothetical protein
VLFAVAPPLSTLHIALNLPIAAWEMVLAGWLIVKGFDVRAVASIGAPAASMTAPLTTPVVAGAAS